MTRGTLHGKAAAARALIALVAVVLGLSAAGCLTASQQSRLQTDMSEVRQQVFDMQKQTVEVLSKVQGMEETLSRQEGASPTRFADLESLLQSLSDQVRTLGVRLDENTSRMATLTQEMAMARQQYRSLDARLSAALATRGLPAPGAAGMAGPAAGDPTGQSGENPPSQVAGSGIAPSGPMSPATQTPAATAPAPAAGQMDPGAGPVDANGSGGSDPDASTGAAPGSANAVPTASQAGPAMSAATAEPADSATQEAAFRAAYSDYSRGIYESALMGFQEFIKAWPDSPLAEGAEYYAGDCLFSQQRFEEATASFGRVIERYPASDKAPAAHLKTGFSLLALKQTARGVIQLQHVIETYPKSDEARLARDRLRQLGLSVR